MEGKYTKLSVVIGLLGLIISISQIQPKEDKKIAGEWSMTCKIIEADFKPYIGMEIKWKIFLTENDQKVKGTAEKVLINNKELDYNLRTSMELEGNIKDDVITLNYIENGKIRKTSGIFIAIIKGNEFTGHFSQTASNTKGELIGVKTEK